MKSHSLYTLAALALLLLPSLAWAGQTVVLFDEKFEDPNGETKNFPPSPGEGFSLIATNVGGWSDGGQVSITYGEKLGVHGSGGLNCTLVSPGTSYTLMNVRGIEIPDVSGTSPLTLEKLKAIKISFFAKIPDGEKLNVAFYASLPRGEEARGYSTRIVFPPIVGTGDFTEYTVSPADLEEKAITPYVDVTNEVLQAGFTEAAINLTLTFDRSFPESSAFQLDNILVTIKE